MSNDLEYLNQAVLMAKMSPDPSTKVGAVIVTPEGNCGRGFNGFPEGVLETEERFSNREEKYPRTVHAEMNAVASAIFEDFYTRGGTIYTTHFPCSDCCGILIQFGIRRVVTFQPDEDYLSRWAKSVEISRSMLEESEVELVFLHDKE